MFAELVEIHRRPEPFSVYTTDVLWTDPHLSRQMLRYHLDPDSDLASRRPSTIDAIVGWIDERFGLQGSAVCDLGCGPGLYARRFAERGARVCGLDFSATSLAHARGEADALGLDIDYRQANYLEDPLPPDQNLFTMIYCDLSTLSPVQRRLIYRKVRQALRPGGAFVFDVMSTDAYDSMQERTTCEHNAMGGFWTAGDSFTFHSTFKYDAGKITLDKYTIVEPHRSWQVFNWMQHFNEADMADELAQNGFDPHEFITRFVADGEKSFAVVAIPK